MEDVDLSSMSKRQLTRLQREIDAQLLELDWQELREAVEHLSNVAARLGVPPQEAVAAVKGTRKSILKDARTPPPAPKRAKTSRKPKAEKPPSFLNRRFSTEGRVEPKFRHPTMNVTWTGRGRVPLWIEEYEANGGDREDLRIREKP